jgi:hypothetical protein
MSRLLLPEFGHCFPEVWSNQFNKWIYIDAYNAEIYLGQDGIPVNTMELHKAQFDSTLFNSISTIKIERLFATPEDREKDDRPVRDKCPVGYGRFGIWLRSNLVDEPAPYPIWDGVSSFRWDGRMWFQNPKVPLLSEFSRYSQREDDLYWSVNQCFLQPYYLGNDKVRVVVSHTMPNIDRIEYRFDTDTAWERTPETISWKLHAGENSLYVRAVNKHGIAGHESTMTVLKQ